MPSRPSTTRPTQHHPTTDRRRRTNASQTNRIRPQPQHHPGINLPQLPRPAARHICSRYPHRPPHQALHHPPCTQRRRPHHHPRRPPHHSRPQHRSSLQHVRRIRLTRHHYVIDFIEIHIIHYHWPDFNVADSCIVIGACLLLIEIFRPQPTN